jgi:hypothetical protein
MLGKAGPLLDALAVSARCVLGKEARLLWQRGNSLLASDEQ